MMQYEVTSGGMMRWSQQTVVDLLSETGSSNLYAHCVREISHVVHMFCATHVRLVLTCAPNSCHDASSPPM
ncbi:hypothetical protein CY34DRAFT_377768 [Suillus luteus UH-Slu-Lm8-n1]|uniref:Uncharacterized protein n=1 Tax=Suillus luteus UH-Slu-Lm8-n1 TaxID=930992 RepID=A0A0D0BU96_9AGAM|nr:hypothetical protein CY34DRAFT_377768 [Suillus luteus UH-Slu-Lm8-n1]